MAPQRNRDSCPKLGARCARAVKPRSLDSGAASRSRASQRRSRGSSPRSSGRLAAERRARPAGAPARIATPAVQPRPRSGPVAMPREAWSGRAPRCAQPPVARLAVAAGCRHARPPVAVSRQPPAASSPPSSCSRARRSRSRAGRPAGSCGRRGGRRGPRRSCRRAMRNHSVPRLSRCSPDFGSRQVIVHSITASSPDSIPCSSHHWPSMFSTPSGRSRRSPARPGAGRAACSSGSRPR